MNAADTSGLTNFQPPYENALTPLTAADVRRVMERFLTEQGWKQNSDGEWWRDGFYAPHTLGMAWDEQELLDATAPRNEGGEAS